MVILNLSMSFWYLLIPFNTNYFSRRCCWGCWWRDFHFKFRGGEEGEIYSRGVIPGSKYIATFTEKVTIFSGRGLEEELSKVHSTLSTTGGSGDWKQRIEALQMVRSLLIAGAGQFDELTSQVGTRVLLILYLFFHSWNLWSIRSSHVWRTSGLRWALSIFSFASCIFVLLMVIYAIWFCLHGKCSGCERMLHHPGIHVPAASSQGE